MKYAEELLYLIAFAIGLTLMVKGTLALAKVVTLKAPVPNGLKEYMSV